VVGKVYHLSQAAWYLDPCEAFKLGQASTDSGGYTETKAEVIKFPTLPVDDYAEPDITEIVANHPKGKDDE
jgi:hypothetical protein